MVLPDFRRQLEISRQKGAADFGNKLFHGIAFVAPPFPAEIAVQAGRVAGPVHGFMQTGFVVALRIAEERKGRHLDVVGTDGVVCPVAAMIDGGAGLGQELFGAFDALPGVQGRRIGAAQ